jgi:hypothetical protein
LVLASRVEVREVRASTESMLAWAREARCSNASTPLTWESSKGTGCKESRAPRLKPPAMVLLYHAAALFTTAIASPTRVVFSSKVSVAVMAVKRALAWVTRALRDACTHGRHTEAADSPLDVL